MSNGKELRRTLMGLFGDYMRVATQSIAQITLINFGISVGVTMIIKRGGVEGREVADVRN